MKRRTVLRLVTIRLSFFALLVVPAACSVNWATSPEATSAENDGIDASSVGQTSAIATATAGDTDDAATDVDAHDDRETNDGGDAGRVCDGDGDGYNDLTKPGCADAGGASDCDDSDPRTHPNQDYLPDLPVAPRLGDWNCVKGVEKLYATNVTCGSLSLFGCSSAGFEGAVDCGKEGSFVQCTAQGLVCGVGTRTTKKQTCR